jgi:hypothetical protein
VRTARKMEGRSDVTKLIAFFFSFVNAPNERILKHFVSFGLINTWGKREMVRGAASTEMCDICTDCNSK